MSHKSHIKHADFSRKDQDTWLEVAQRLYQYYRKLIKKCESIEDVVELFTQLRLIKTLPYLAAAAVQDLRICKWEVIKMIFLEIEDGLMKSDTKTSF